MHSPQSKLKRGKPYLSTKEPDIKSKIDRVIKSVIQERGPFWPDEPDYEDPPTEERPAGSTPSGETRKCLWDNTFAKTLPSRSN